MNDRTSEAILQSPDYQASVDFSYAYQPIVNTLERRVTAYEALIRGKAQESAWHVLQQVPDHKKYIFDQVSRCAAVQLAGRLGLSCQLNLNHLPRSLAVSDTAISSTISAAKAAGLRTDQLVLEITETESVEDVLQFKSELSQYQALGLKTAIDDFGAGYSGLNLLAEFQPDQVKIDMKLVRGIHADGPRQSIVRAVCSVCLDLGIDVIAEGVETVDEYAWLCDQGIELFQGYLFAKPAFETLGGAEFPV
jgi:EAL domain-containing protein (putative c-di-GMP-specific phosphodiesterase class I)